MKHQSASVQAPVAVKRGPESWLSSLGALDVQFLILNAKLDKRLLKLLQAHPERVLDFSDDEAFMFARTGAF